MSFRMRNISTANQEDNPKPEKKEKTYTQEDLDLIAAKYNEREERIRKYIEDPANPLLEEYRKSLLKEDLGFAKETIIYDKNIGKWKIIKQENKN